MGKIFKIRSSEYPLIKEGKYIAEFVGCRDLKGLKFGDAVSWDFKITDSQSDAYGLILGLLCSDKESKNSKQYGVIKALLGEEPKEGTEIDSDAFKEKMCKVVVKTKTNGENKFSVVSEVLPFEEEGKKKEG